MRPATAADAAAIVAIYNHYVRETVVTFEEDPLPTEEMAGRLRAVEETGLPWLVIETAQGVQGYSYATRWHGRCAYRFTAEITVYLAPEAGGQGLGSALYRALFAELAQRGFRTALGAIALPNAASVALHEKFGMAQVGQFREVGYKFERWIDVGYWQGTITAACHERPGGQDVPLPDPPSAPQSTP
ncbi:N-acetyltransferase family protein [Aestuariirhabdus litorea]|uniref:N-acetyltransferase family protein n=1 Tax=Aestuariirhabdus litorea TaxID=2528527 RepID=A0A3P3VXK5_9GAMM|nr:N-acetyltransferase family protein [Aestuariirhabdus litorea]RWW98637.1 GNAT family N-acetyltransferase [Endozoicomonadaceae bacterium GTF-13]